MAARFPRHWILVFIVIAALAAAWLFRRREPQYPSAYVSDRAATLWSSTAVVRQPVATLVYGSRVAVMRRVGDQAQVRTAEGASGWLDARLLMDPELWQQSADLLARARTLPVMGIGHTKAFSNVHLEPGRQTSRIFQFGRDVPLQVFERKMVPVASAAAVPSAVPVANVKPATNTGKDAVKNSDVSQETAAPDDSAKGQQPKEEEWVLVMRNPNGAASSVAATNGSSFATQQSDGSGAAAAGTTDATATIPMAGWVLAQFVALDPPQPIPDYAGASGLDVVAWVTLDPAVDADGAKPQYLVAGDHDGATRGCDFNALRAYTWGATQKRYETAYIENDLCGKLPIRVRKSPDGTEFSFTAADENNRNRVYRMKQTTVRLVTESKPSKGR